MRALQTEISNALYSHIAVVERKGPYFNSPFHYHPEFELIYINEGYGNRIIGDKLDSFNAGDLVFIGSNLPHEFRLHEDLTNDPSSHAIVAYFNKEVFAKGFYDLRESHKINMLLKKAARGIKVTGHAQVLISQKMQEMVQKKDFERIIGLMEILHLLSISDEIEYLVYEGYEGTIPETNCDRLAQVFNYVTANFNQDISLEEISRVVHLTPPAFCRLFKQKTNRPFVSYLNEVRISNACKYLTETSYNISEVAFHCGYKTLSNFNKFFKKSTGLSPKQYREKALA